MASTGSGAQQGGVVNGSHSNGRNQTPADLVGNQFVSQFYTVLHSSPNYLYRFYTDSSTLTHADQGVDGEQPTTYTVSSQKAINERVLAMGFEEAVTEIWSVDSQYSQNDGVLVMVTGSLQCKGKKKRDFVQSFFLAVQEKGYFVLNDVFRYLSDRNKPQYPKENGYVPQYDKSAYQAGGGYHTNYFPGQGAPHHGPAGVYQSMHYPSPGALTQSAAQVTLPPQPRTAAVTPSGPPQAPPPRAMVAPVPKPLATAPVSAPAPTPPAPLVPQQAPPPASVAPPPQQPAPVSAPPSAAPSQFTPEAPRAIVPPAPTPTPAATPAQEPSKASEPKPEAVPAAQPKPATHAPEEPKPEAPTKAAEPEEKQVPAAPSAPLSYADRLKMGAAKAARPAPSKPSSAPPKPSLPIPAKEEAVPEASASADEPSTILTNGDVGLLAEEHPMTSIFVRDLPADVTAEKIEEAFQRFGSIKGGVAGVNLKQQKGKEDFAFVEFDEAAAKQAAIEGSVFVGDQKVSVVERRPMIMRGGGRGSGYPRGRGGDRGGDRGGYRSGPGRSDRGRGGRGGYQGRSDGPGRGGEGRGRGGYSNGPGFPGGEGRGRSSDRGGRGPPRDGPREGGRGPSRVPQSAPPARAQA